MKKKSNEKYLMIWIAVMICLLFGKMTSYAVSDIVQMEGSGSIQTESLNVRSGPGKEYEVIGKVYETDTVTITGSMDGWYRILYDGTEGFVSSDYVTVSEVSGEDNKKTNQPPSSMEESIEEGDMEESSFFLAQYKMPLLLLAVIVVMIIVIFITFQGIRKMDEDEDEDEDEYEYEDEGEDEDIYERSHTRHVKPEKGISPARRTLSNNPDDYRVYIDPIYFEEDDHSAKETSASKRDEDLKRAMKKMEELQREIERIKNEK